jgi:hypothetical protein
MSITFVDVLMISDEFSVLEGFFEFLVKDEVDDNDGDEADDGESDHFGAHHLSESLSGGP